MKNNLLKAILYALITVAGILIIFSLIKWTEKIEEKQTQKNYVYLSDSSSEYTEEEIRAMNVFAKCSVAVVHINTTSNESSLLNTEPETGVGSGFFVSEDGYICTNEHVILDSSSIEVTTSDGSIYGAVLVGTDSENDIAVLKINADKKTKFEYLTFDSSQDLKVGQRVYAIGNPFGFDRTLSSGSVSGLSRPIRDDNGKVLLGMVQTDAAINPGNSGGPLLNSKGNVVGVCAAIYSNGENSQGLNFAVSSDDASASVQDIIKYGKVKRGWLDIIPVVLSQQIVDYSGLKVSKGILVSQVIPSGKADVAGIKGGNKQVKYGNSSVIYVGGDVITKVNGIEVTDFSDLFTALSKTRPGDKIEVVVNRNGKQEKIKVELVERTAELVSYTNR